MRTTWQLAAWAAIALVMLGTQAAEETVDDTIGPTTVLVVRHAEKAKNPDDPALTNDGRQRARRLRDLAIDAGVGVTYATQYRRTQETVAPLSEALGIETTVIDARKTEDLLRDILENRLGQVVVVAGHSDTVPAIVAGLGGQEPAAIDESEYDNLFVVIIPPEGTAHVLRLKY